MGDAEGPQAPPTVDVELDSGRITITTADILPARWMWHPVDRVLIIPASLTPLEVVEVLDSWRRTRRAEEKLPGQRLPA